MMSGGISLLHTAMHMAQDAAEDDDVVRGSAKSAFAGAGGAVGTVMLVGTAPFSLPVVAVGAGVGLAGRALYRAFKK